MYFPYFKMRTPALEKYVHWQPDVPQENNRRSAVGEVWQVPIVSLWVKSCHSHIKPRSWPSDPSVGFALHRPKKSEKHLCEFTAWNLTLQWHLGPKGRLVVYIYRSMHNKYTVSSKQSTNGINNPAAISKEPTGSGGGLLSLHL